MALFDEQLVEEWLNRDRFFTIRGVKSGVDEIDLLAIRKTEDAFECWHIEVQVSYRPIGYVGGDTNARKRTSDEVKAGVEQWVEKKFTSEKKVARRNEILPDVRWKYVFVHGVLRDQSELEIMRSLGIETLPYREVLAALRDDVKSSNSSSTASNIAEMLRYMSSPE